MDSKRATQDKLACVVRCSKHIFSILKYHYLHVPFQG